MNDGLRQRLIGAIVLVSIALILWPLLFSDPNLPDVDRRSQIPPTPAFQSFEVPEPSRPQQTESVRSVRMQETETQLAIANPQPVANSKPSAQPAPLLDERGLPIAWVLQVASFSDAANANEVKQRLQKKGYKAYTTTVKLPQGNITRVYVGPKMTQEALLNIKPAIDKLLQVDAIIVRFQSR